MQVNFVRQRMSTTGMNEEVVSKSTSIKLPLLRQWLRIPEVSPPSFPENQSEAEQHEPPNFLHFTARVQLETKLLHCLLAQYATSAAKIDKVNWREIEQRTLTSSPSPNGSASPVGSLGPSPSFKKKKRALTTLITSRSQSIQSRLEWRLSAIDDSKITLSRAARPVATDPSASMAGLPSASLALPLSARFVFALKKRAFRVRLGLLRKAARKAGLLKLPDVDYRGQTPGNALCTVTAAL